MQNKEHCIKNTARKSREFFSTQKSIYSSFHLILIVFHRFIICLVPTQSYKKGRKEKEAGFAS